MNAQETWNESSDERLLLEVAVSQKNYEAAWPLAAILLDRYESERLRLAAIEEAAQRVVRGAGEFGAETLQSVWRDRLDDLRAALDPKGVEAVSPMTMSDEAAINLLREQPCSHNATAREMGAAAIAAQRELVDALERFVSETSRELPLHPKHRKMGGHYMRDSCDLLVRFGRVRKDGDSYKWVTP